MVRLERTELSLAEWKALVAEASTGECMLIEFCALANDAGTAASHLYHYAQVASEIKPTDDILEVGCGSGLAARLYRVKTDGRVVAVDRPPAIEIARSLYYAPGIEYFSLDFAEAALPDGSFDLVTFTEVYEHLPEAVGSKVLDEISARLRPDGRLLMSVPLISGGHYAKDFQFHVRDFEDEDSVLLEVSQHLRKGQSVRLVRVGYTSEPVMGKREEA